MFGLIQIELGLTGIANDFTQFHTFEAMTTYLEQVRDNAPKKHYVRWPETEEQYKALVLTNPVMVLLISDAYGQRSFYFATQSETNPVHG